MTDTRDPDLVERRSPSRGLGERILVLTPTGDDAPLVSQILRDADREVVVLDDLGSVITEIEAGAGVVLIASETLDDRASCASLRGVLDRQEPWSDIPLLVLGGSGEAEAAGVTQLLGPRTQVVLLERPLGIATLLSAVDAALRSRRRQYEVKRLLQELADSAAAIARAHAEADRAKDEFLATLAHELRSPMTAILGWIQMLKMPDLEPSDAASALGMIESSTKVQAHIIEDLMDVSRILAGKVMTDPALIDVRPIVTNVVATFRPAADRQGIDLTADIPPEPLTAWADEVRLQQVGWNLVSNAIKFTPRGGSVRVTLIREDDMAVIRVSDTGQGIARELLPHVFERYRQEEGATAKQSHGLGLGLAIVRHLVESHGGSIQAFSEGPGKGSDFVVKLPLRVPPESGRS